MKVRFSIMAVVLIVLLIFINCGSDQTSGVDSDPPQASSLSVEYTGSKDIGRAIHTIEPINFRNNPTGSSTASVNVATTGKGCQVTANWTQCSSDDFASYTLYRSTNQFISSDTTSATRLATVSTASSTSYTDNAVTIATTYYYALKTTDDSGLTSWSNEVDVTTPQSSESPSPSDLSLAFTGDSKANTVSSAMSALFGNGRSSRAALSSQTTEKGSCEVTATWTECPDGDFLSYTLYRSTSPGISQDTTGADNMGTFTSVSNTEYVDGSVDWETTYYYALITRDTQDLFAWSDEESITTPSSQGGDITVTEPTSSTVWEYGQTNTTVSWTGTATTNVRIEIWQNGTKLDDYSDWVPNTGSYTRTSALPASWGTGADYQIKVIDQDDSYGLSENFLLNGTIDVTTPDSGTLWTVGETNTQVEWTGGGAQVKLEVWNEGQFVEDFSGWLSNTGTYTRVAPIPSSWSIGEHFRIRVVDSSSSQEDGWSDDFRITALVDITTPNANTIWAWGQEGMTVNWIEPYSDNVTIYVYKGGSSVATFASSVPNTGSYTRAEAIPSLWGSGENFQIKVVGDLGSSGYSSEFCIWAIDLTEPNSSTIWQPNQANTEVHWELAPGNPVRIEIWQSGSKIDDYCDWTDNDGEYTLASGIPVAWGEGNGYQIKMIDALDNVGWSEEFTIDQLVEEGLASWLFTNGSLQDYSGNGNDATNYGAVIASDRFDNATCAYEFDGDASKKIITMNLNSYNVISISIWVKITGAGGGAFYSGDNGGWDRGIHYDTDRQIHLHTGTGNAATGIVIPSGEWVHMVVMYGSASMRLYVDSELLWTRSTPANGWNEGDWWIGRAPHAYPSTAIIDDVRIYTKELIESEIYGLYHEGGWGI